MICLHCSKTCMIYTRAYCSIHDKFLPSSNAFWIYPSLPQVLSANTAFNFVYLLTFFLCGYFYNRKSELWKMNFSCFGISSMRELYSTMDVSRRARFYLYLWSIWQEWVQKICNHIFMCVYVCACVKKCYRHSTSDKAIRAQVSPREGGYQHSHVLCSTGKNSYQLEMVVRIWTPTWSLKLTETPCGHRFSQSFLHPCACDNKS